VVATATIVQATLTDVKELKACLADLAHARKAHFGADVQELDTYKFAILASASSASSSHTAIIHLPESGRFATVYVPRKLTALALDVLFHTIANLVNDIG
jgi:hypothetical protein